MQLIPLIIMIAMKLLFKPKKPRFDPIAQRIFSSTDKLPGKVLPVIYGRAHVYGNCVYRNIATDKTWVHEIIALGWGPLTVDNTTIRINEKRPNKIDDADAPDLTVEPKYISELKVWFHNGAAGQAIHNADLPEVKAHYKIFFDAFVPFYYNRATLTLDGTTYQGPLINWSDSFAYPPEAYEAPYTQLVQEARANEQAQAIYDQIIADPAYPSKPWTASIAVEARSRGSIVDPGEGSPYWDGSTLNIKVIKIQMKLYGETVSGATGNGVVIETTNYSGGGNISSVPLDYGLNRTCYFYVSGKANDDFNQVDKFECEVTRGNLFVAGSGYNTPIVTSSRSSSNPIAACLDYLLNTDYGCGRDPSKVNVANFEAAMDYCDQTVGDEPRWTLNGEFGKGENDTHENIIEQILEVCGGQLYESDGKICVWLPRAKASVMDFDRSNFEPKAVAHRDIADMPNIVEIAYRQKVDNEQRVVTYLNQADLLEWGENREEYRFDGIRSRTQASRLASLMGRRFRTEVLQVKGTADQRALALEPGDVIRLTMGDADTTWFTNKKFWVDSIVPDDERGDVELTLLEYGGDGLYDDAQSLVIDNNNQIISSDASVSLPSPNQKPLSPTVVTARLQPIMFTGSRQFSVRVEWSIPVQPSYMHDRFVIYRRKQGSDPWEPVGSVNGPASFWLDSDVQPFSYNYYYAVVSKTTAGVESDIQSPYGALLPMALPIGSSGTLSALAKHAIKPEGFDFYVDLSWPTFGDVVKRIGYKVEYRRSGRNWEVASEFVQGLAYKVNIDLPGTYDFKVSPANIDGTFSEPIILTGATIGPPDYPVPTISGLEIADRGMGQGNDVDFKTNDVLITWRVNSPSTDDQPMDEHASGFDPAFIDPLFSHFAIQVFDGVSGALIRSATTQDRFFRYSFEQNLTDGGPRRSIKLSVRYVDRNNKISAESAITVANAAPPVPALSVTNSGFAQAVISYDPALLTDFDVAGMVVHASTSSGFTPGTGNQVYKGNQTTVAIPFPDYGTKYLKIALYDSFGTDLLNYSVEYAISPSFGIDVGGAPAAPVWPGSGFLTTSIEIQNDGTAISRIAANWTANAESDLSRYVIAYKKTADSEWSNADSTVNRFEFIASPGVSYDVRVQAADTFGNESAWSVTKTITAATDSTIPGTVLSVVGTASFKEVFFTWTNPTDKDLSYVEIWEHTANDRSLSTKIAEVSSNAFVRAGLTTGNTRYYWFRAVDTYGNAGSWSHTQFAGLSVTVSAVSSNDISTGAIQNQHVLAGGLTTDRLAVGGVGMTNYIENPDFEVAGVASTAEWTPGNGFTTAAAEDATVSAPASCPRLRVLKIVPKLSTNERMMQTSQKACNPGEKFVLLMNAASAPSTSAPIWYGVFWLDKNRAQIGGGDYVSVAQNSSWADYTRVTAAAPAGTCYVQFSVVIIAAASPTGAWYVNHVEMRKQTAGVEIVDGAVTADKVAANAITADKILARSITTDRLTVLDINNLLQNPDAEVSGVAQWWASGYTMTRQTSGLPSSARRLTAWRINLISSSGIVSALANDPTSLSNLIRTPIPGSGDPSASLAIYVVGGVSYNFKMPVNMTAKPASGTTLCYAIIGFYGVGGLIGTAVAGVTTIAAINTWYDVQVTGKAPDNAIYAVASLQFVNTTSQTITGTQYVWTTAGYFGRSVAAGYARSFTAGSISLPAATWTSVQSASIFGTGATIQIMARVDPSGSASYRIKRDSTVIYDSQTAPAQEINSASGNFIYWTDTPAAGAIYAYSIELYPNSATNATNRLLSLIDLGS